MSNDPTTGELKIIIEDMKQKSEERHNDYKERDDKFMTMFEKMDKKLDDIISQTTRTNGRVNKHDWQFKVAWWGLGALWTVLLFGVPMLYRLYNYSLDQKFKDFAEKNREIINEVYDERVEKTLLSK